MSRPVDPRSPLLARSAAEGAITRTRSKKRTAMPTSRRFKLEVRMDNAAFEDEYELGRILRDIANKVDSDYKSGHAIDTNGNSVGRWAILEGKSR